jgi:hypothetical protein
MSSLSASILCSGSCDCVFSQITHTVIDVHARSDSVLRLQQVGFVVWNFSTELLKLVCCRCESVTTPAHARVFSAAVSCTNAACHCTAVQPGMPCPCYDHNTRCAKTPVQQNKQHSDPSRRLAMGLCSNSQEARAHITRTKHHPWHEQASQDVMSTL